MPDHFASSPEEPALPAEERGGASDSLVRVHVVHGAGVGGDQGWQCPRGLESRTCPEAPKSTGKLQGVHVPVSWKWTFGLQQQAGYQIYVLSHSVGHAFIHLLAQMEPGPIHYPHPDLASPLASPQTLFLFLHFFVSLPSEGGPSRNVGGTGGTGMGRRPTLGPSVGPPRFERD